MVKELPSSQVFWCQDAGLDPGFTKTQSVFFNSSIQKILPILRHKIVMGLYTRGLNFMCYISKTNLTSVLLIS